MTSLRNESPKRRITDKWKANLFESKNPADTRARVDNDPSQCSIDSLDLNEFSKPIKFSNVKIVHIWSPEQKRYYNIRCGAAFEFLKKHGSKKNFMLVRDSENILSIYDVTHKSAAQFLDLLEYFSAYSAVLGVGKIRFSKNGKLFQVKKVSSVSLTPVFQCKDSTIIVVTLNQKILSDQNAKDYLNLAGSYFTVTQKIEAKYTQSGVLISDVRSTYTFTEIDAQDKSQSYSYLVKLDDIPTLGHDADRETNFIISVVSK